MGGKWDGDRDRKRVGGEWQSGRRVCERKREKERERERKREKERDANKLDPKLTVVLGHLLRQVSAEQAGEHRKGLALHRVVVRVRNVPAALDVPFDEMAHRLGTDSRGSWVLGKVSELSEELSRSDSGDKDPIHNDVSLAHVEEVELLHLISLLHENVVWVLQRPLVLFPELGKLRGGKVVEYLPAGVVAVMGWGTAGDERGRGAPLGPASHAPCRVTAFWC